jgi:arylsulfatase A-like enzyme
MLPPLHRFVIFLMLATMALPAKAAERKPNILVVLADQWRAQAFGFAGDPNVKTPNFDRLASESVRFFNAVAGLPVCSPTRASLLTGQRPLTHGVFLNDVPLDPNATTIAKVLKAEGYDTGYIGKWHLTGDGRSNFIPRDRRQGFDYWKALECTHDYSNSFYYADAPDKLKWAGYDAIAQMQDACDYIRRHSKTAKPFLLFLAWGPPHDPYFTAPAKYRVLYQPSKLTLRPNIPATLEDETRRILAGYYAHCTALDDCMGELLQTLRETGVAEDTILVFSADHGDMLGSQGMFKKQKPYDESIRVPMLVRWPRGLSAQGRSLDAPINSEDVMPTLLGLCGVPIPKSVEGLDYSHHLRGGKSPGDDATVILCAAPFGEWERRVGGKEYRGIRTTRYTYVRDLNGPWLFFDNQIDPYQTNNLVKVPAQAALQSEMDALLKRKLKERGDEFRPGAEYIARWAYKVNANGTVPNTP